MDLKSINQFVKHEAMLLEKTKTVDDLNKEYRKTKVAIIVFAILSNIGFLAFTWIFYFILKTFIFEQKLLFTSISLILFMTCFVYMYQMYYLLKHTYQAYTSCYITILKNRLKE
jgi:hypothetical protein